MTTPSSELRSTGVDAAGLLLRMLVGFIFFMHGYQKLFVFGLEGTAAEFTQMGAPLSSSCCRCSPARWPSR